MTKTTLVTLMRTTIPGVTVAQASKFYDILVNRMTETLIQQGGGKVQFLKFGVISSTLRPPFVCKLGCGLPGLKPMAPVARTIPANFTFKFRISQSEPLQERLKKTAARILNAARTSSNYK
jgi:hypothetical protein